MITGVKDSDILGAEKGRVRRWINTRMKGMSCTGAMDDGWMMRMEDEKPMRQIDTRTRQADPRLLDSGARYSGENGETGGANGE